MKSGNQFNFPHYTPCPRRFEGRADNAIHVVRLYEGVLTENLKFFQNFSIIYIENEREMNFENFIKSIL